MLLAGLRNLKKTKVQKQITIARENTPHFIFLILIMAHELEIDCLTLLSKCRLTLDLGPSEDPCTKNAHLCVTSYF